jgi:cellulose biosynthesis protein BcsQ
MSIYAFHSYKGGAGRTLAVANVARAFRRKRKKVLVIDFDFEAPGLPHKFNVLKSLNQGYVDYVITTSTHERSIGGSRCLEILKSMLIKIDNDDEFLLLPAGNHLSRTYWNLVASHQFRQAFTIGGEVKGDEKIAAFKADIKLICQAADYPDIVLIDCKATQEPVAIATMFWAHHVVEFFHCNCEGVYGAAIMLQALEKQQYEGRKMMVLSRVPFPGSQKAAAEAKRVFYIKNCYDYASELGFGDHKGLVRALSDARVIHEHPELEVGDYTLGNDDEVSPAASFYVELAHCLEPLWTDHELERLWPTMVSMSEGHLVERVFELSLEKRVFELSPEKGYLYNDDKQRNVALRIQTITNFMSELVNHQQREFFELPQGERMRLIAHGFRQAGLSAGNNFGTESKANPATWVGGFGPPEHPAELLEQWCRFDRRAGFGQLSSHYSEATRSGTIHIPEHFLEGVADGMGHRFMEGYIEGVLRVLLGEHIEIESRISEGEILFRLRATPP